MNHYLSKLMTYQLVHQMEQEGFSIKKIAARCKLSWRTAKRLLAITEKEFLLEGGERSLRKRTLAFYESFVKNKLAKYPDTPAAQMHDWLKEEYPDFPVTGRRTVFNFVQFVRSKYNILKGESTREYFCVPELEYGLQGQADFGFYNMPTTQHGKNQKVQFFTFVLSRSRYKFIFFTVTPFTTETSIDAHERTFQALGGRPSEVVYDQDRVFMTAENQGDLLLTAGFRAYVNESKFSTHFCRKADPESKGKVENVVKYVKRNFLYNRTFKDLETLNYEATAWLARTANAMEHGTTRKIPTEEFEIEKVFLAPWYPVLAEPQAYPQYAVHKDNKISYKSNIYSLPLGTYKDKTTRIFLKVTADQLILLDLSQREICRHQISRLKGQKILATDHMRDKSAAVSKLLLEFSEMMDNQLQALNWVNQIKDCKPRYVRDQVLLLKATVKDLDRHIASQALNYACQHQILSASDFKAITLQLLREQTTSLLPQPKIVQLNPLDGQGRKLAETVPEQSKLSTYDSYFTHK